MPVRDCMTGSPYCPATMDSKFAISAFESEGCDSCVKKSLDKGEVPRCFFNKLDRDKRLDLIDYTVETFAKKVMELKQKSHR